MWTRAVRWIAGLLLVVAAALKAFGLVTNPTTVILNPLGRYFLPVQIGVEFALGVLFLTGLYWRRLRWLGLALFTGFGGYSLYLALHGAASCGCFGPVHLSTWWTFGLDIAVVVGLSITAWRDFRTTRNAMQAGRHLQITLHTSHHVLVALIIAFVVISVAALFRYADRQIAAASSIAAVKGDLVILEPEKWIGEKLPIADFIDTDLSRGEWVGVLHHHDCSECQAAMPHYEQLAASGQRVALIEMPPYGFEPSLGSKCVCCRLKDNRDWFVQTPVEISLRDGIVTAVKEHDE